jgi:hypothetical protein
MEVDSKPQFNDGQQARALDLINNMPWGDADVAIRTMEEALRPAMEATRDDFQLWEAQADAGGFEDEFALSANDVVKLLPEWRLAYVARLLRTLALMYGVSTDYPDPEASLVFENDEQSPSGLLRGLNDISWMV